MNDSTGSSQNLQACTCVSLAKPVARQHTNSTCHDGHHTCELLLCSCDVAVLLLALLHVAALLLLLLQATWLLASRLLLLSSTTRYSYAALLPRKVATRAAEPLPLRALVPQSPSSEKELAPCSWARAYRDGLLDSHYQRSACCRHEMKTGGSVAVVSPVPLLTRTDQSLLAGNVA